MCADLGQDLSWYRPVTPRNDDPYLPGQLLGTYRKGFEGLNVAHPQPGFQYQWVNLRNPSEVSRRQMQGFQLVQIGDPEAEGYVNYTVTRGTPQASLLMFGNLALSRIPIERHRALRQERRDLYKARITGPTHDFVERGQEIYAELRGRGIASASGQAYYQRADHGVEGEEVDLSPR